jgi:uncharacterized phage protein (TIGR01671 family)
MNREIKFRGYSSILSKWVYGSLLQNEDGEGYIIPFKNVELDGHHIQITGDEPVFVEQGTITRYVGFIDKNRKEIFEGDELHIKDCNDMEWDTFVEKDGIIDYDADDYDCTMLSFLDFEDFDIEIIRNKFNK